MPATRTSPQGSQTTRSAPLPPTERRAVIVAAALPLILEHGEAVTTRAIASAAGIAEGTIFRVFRDKDDVIAASIDACLEPSAFEAAVADIDLTGSLDERLVAAVELLSQRMLTIWRMRSALGPRHHGHLDRSIPDSPGLAALFAPDADRLGVDPVRAARLLRSMTVATTHPTLAPDPLDPPAVVDLLLHGIEVRP